MATKLTGTKCQSYMVSDKLRIINFAEQHGNRAAEREFGVSESNIRLWWESKENLEKMPQLKRANRGKKAAWPELEVDLLEWITEKRNNGLAILPSLVRLKALDMAKNEKYGIPQGQFKAGNCWCQHFMKRNGLSLRQRQLLPSSFQLTMRRKLCDSTATLSIFAKSTLILFRLSLTWLKRRKQTETDGNLQKKNSPEGCQQAQSCNRCSRERLDGRWRNENMDRESLAFEERWPGRRRSLLVCDAFEAHVTERVRKHISEEMIESSWQNHQRSGWLRGRLSLRGQQWFQQRTRWLIYKRTFSVRLRVQVWWIWYLNTRSNCDLWVDYV